MAPKTVDGHPGGGAQGCSLGELGIQGAVGEATDHLGLMLRPQGHRLDGLSAPEPEGREPQQGPGGQEHSESDQNTLGVASVWNEGLDPGAGGGGDPGNQGADQSDDDAAAVDGVAGEVPHRGVGVHPAGDGVQDQPRHTWRSARR